MLIAKDFTCQIQVRLFAGDTVISFSNHNKEVLLVKVNSVLNQLYIFITLSLLYVNVNETNFIAYRRIATPPYFAAKFCRVQKPHSNICVRNILEFTWIVICHGNNTVIWLLQKWLVQLELLEC